MICTVFLSGVYCARGNGGLNSGPKSANIVTDALWYGNWNRHICHKWIRKNEVDRPSRSTEVNPGKKQKCCYLSCLRSQVQRDTSDPGIILRLWVVYGQNIVDVPILVCDIEQRCQLFPAGWEQRLINSASLISSARRGEQLVTIGIPTIC